LKQVPAKPGRDFLQHAGKRLANEAESFVRKYQEASILAQDDTVAGTLVEERDTAM
jgi:hypothetical protein